MQSVRWCLENTSDPINKWRFPIDPVPFTIGRNDGCNLTLRSQGVSRYHAQLNVSGDMLWIRDSGSTNGTLLNGKAITESEALNSGDSNRAADLLAAQARRLDRRAQRMPAAERRRMSEEASRLRTSSRRARSARSRPARRRASLSTHDDALSGLGF